MKAVNNSTDLFRKALSDIYQIFLSNDPKENATEKALVKIKSLYNADRIQLIHLNNENNTLHFVCEIANSQKEKISSSLGKLMHGKSSCFQKDLPWIVKQIREGKQVIVTDIKKLPAEASTEKETLSKNNLNSFLCIPIFCCGGIYGLIGIDFQDKRSDWTETDKEDFNFFANTFSLYLEREKANKAVKQSSMQALHSDILFENIFETLPVGIELYDEKGYLININPYELEVLGTTTEGILGINIFDNPTLSKEEIEAIKAGKEVTFDRD
jgi:GAF domain-containing protein